VTLWQKFKLLTGLNAVWNEAQEAATKAAQEGKMGQAKSIFASWTFWFNMLMGVWVLLDQQGVLGMVPEAYQPLVGVLGNLLLRFKTTQPVSLPGVGGR